MLGFVNVCDQLKGCSTYYSSIIKVIYSNRSRYEDNVLTSYDFDTKNTELIPLYSFAYIYTYQLNVAEIIYIYDNLIDYLKKKSI